MQKIYEAVKNYFVSLRFGQSFNRSELKLYDLLKYGKILKKHFF